MGFGHEAFSERTNGARIRVLRAKVSLGATRRIACVCLTSFFDCAACVHFRCSHGHAPGADLKWKERAAEAESALITFSGATFP